MAQMLFETSLGEQPLAVRALIVFWRLSHLLSPAVSFTVMVFPARPRSAALLLPPWPRGVKRRSAATVTSARMTHRTHKVYGSLANRHDAGVFVNRVILDTWCCWPRCWRIACSIALTTVGRADTQSLAGRDEGAPVSSQRHVDAETAERSPDGSSEAGRRAELVLYADEHDDAAVVAEEARLGTVEVCPVANVTELVVAQPAG